MKTYFVELQLQHNCWKIVGKEVEFFGLFAFLQRFFYGCHRTDSSYFCSMADTFPFCLHNFNITETFHCLEWKKKYMYRPICIMVMWLWIFLIEVFLLLTVTEVLSCPLFHFIRNYELGKYEQVKNLIYCFILHLINFKPA